LNTLECPYCFRLLPDPESSPEQDEETEGECCHCGKRFLFTTEYYPTYHEKKADCLNGEPHKYEMTRTFPKEFRELKCYVCGKRKWE